MKHLLKLCCLTFLLTVGLPAQAGADALALVLIDGARLSSLAQAEAREVMGAAAVARGHAPIDLTLLTSGILGAEMMVPEFDRKPPPGWPEPLLADWEEAHGACRAQIGSPGGSPKRRLQLAAAAVECQRILSEALFARLVAHLGSKTVLEVSVRLGRGGKEAPLRLTGRLFVPGQPTARMLQSEAKKDILQGAISALSSALLEGGGAQETLVRSAALPARPQETIARLEVEPAQLRLAEVSLPDGCVGKLPAELQLRPEPSRSHFSATLTERYRRSALRQRPSTERLDCSLRGYPTRVNSMGNSVDAVEVILTCGKDELRAVMALEDTARRRRESLQDVVSQNLIRQLAALRCEGGP